MSYKNKLKKRKDKIKHNKHNIGFIDRDKSNVKNPLIIYERFRRRKV